MIFIFLVLGVFFLAYSNGANDNFKGVATLFGSDTTPYRSAIGWATVMTLAGSLSSLVFADALVSRFSGKGLVPDALVSSPHFLLAVALGAGLTVILATWTGFPISTTHSLTGALVGAGLAAVGMKINLDVLGTVFFLPLLISPILAMAMAAGGYLFFRRMRLQMGVTEETCLCVGETTPAPALQPDMFLAATGTAPIGATISDDAACTSQYSGTIVGLNAQKVLDSAHYLSSGIVSYARGLNDTPKIVALILAVKGLGIQWGFLAVGLAMAMGGLLNARKVAETMSRKITPMNPGQGFTANLVTGVLVVFATRLGVPVSTTHVSVGSLFGIGTVTREANTKMVKEISLSWVLTLPVAAFFSALVFWIA